VSTTEATTSTGSAAAAGLDAEAITAAVESSMEELRTPAAVVLVRQGDDEYLEAFGTRTVDGDEPVTVDDYFRVGSITKTWVATVVLQLVDEGLVSLDDPISDYVDGVPNGENISVEQVLTMRSGLADYSSLPVVNQAMDDEPDRVWEPTELVALAAAVPPLFPPGDGYFYANTNTVLAGLLIEDVTGNDLAEELSARLFEPLGLDGSSFPAVDDASLPEPHPNGYLFGTALDTVDGLELPPEEQALAQAGELRPHDMTFVNPSWGWAAGAGISTATDLADYVEVLVGGGLLTDELQQERLDSLVPNDPERPEGAGYGWGLASFGPMIGHDGSLPGFQSFMVHDPASELTIVVLVNIQNAPDGQGPASEIARSLMGMLLPPSPPD
jgi:D-alanyl-D-alanine carboxypeptidase